MAKLTPGPRLTHYPLYVCMLMSELLQADQRFYCICDDSQPRKKPPMAGKENGSVDKGICGLNKQWSSSFRNTMGSLFSNGKIDMSTRTPDGTTMC